MLITAAFIIALFFAMNIGASGTAASMGAAYASEAITKRWIAAVLVGISALTGAVIGGGEVVKTIGKGIIPSDILTIQIVLIILAAACSTLFISNIISIPLSTSQVTVGSIVGVGLAFQKLFIGKVLFIVGVWVAVPIIAFSLSFLLGKVNPLIEKKLSLLSNQNKVQKILLFFLITTGCYEAFAAGMNNVANAIGPLVGAGFLEANTGVWLGGIFVALGALILGGRVLETNKKITSMSYLQGSWVSLVSGTLAIGASMFGIPVPLTQATTMSILGIGVADNGLITLKSSIVKSIIKVWVISPISSLVVSFTLVQTLILGEVLTIFLLSAIILSTFGFMVYLKSKEKGKGILTKT